MQKRDPARRVLARRLVIFNPTVHVLPLVPNESSDLGQSGAGASAVPPVDGLNRYTQVGGKLLDSRVGLPGVVLIMLHPFPTRQGARGFESSRRVILEALLHCDHGVMPEAEDHSPNHTPTEEQCWREFWEIIAIAHAEACMRNRIPRDQQGVAAEGGES